MAGAKRKAWWVTGAGVVALGIVVALTLYDKLWREEPQPDWVVHAVAEGEFGDTQFEYLSIGNERAVGLPYWVFYVLPMLFPEKLPGIGGYGAFGLPWEQGVEMPIGFTKVTIGYPRVGFNCALCHTTRYRKNLEEYPPTFVPAGPGHTANIEALSRFFYDCAKDPRFDSDNLLSAIENFTELDLVDKILYRFYIIPATKRHIIAAGENFLWTYRKDPSAWGRGTDGPTYSSRYLPDDMPQGYHLGSTQFPAIWNLAKYRNSGQAGDAQRLNVIGDGRDIHAVIVTSLTGLFGSATPDAAKIESEAKAFGDYLVKARPAPFPGTVTDATLTSGKAAFDQECASCHAESGAGVGRLMPVAEVGTDPDYADRWAAASGNKPAYTVSHLDGIWLRGPYLHNGSVPSLRDLLLPAAQRPKQFYRGNDVLDAKNGGFFSRVGDHDAERRGNLFDTTLKGNGNQGHEYGTSLPDDQKDDLIAYLETL
ncbi:Cytochrome c [Rhizobiales bacterium GAS188]|nr:Cytochrome c [Rhizobiales bacterium GAS188]